MQRIAACVWVLGTLVGSVLAEPMLEYAPAPDGPWAAVADTFLGERPDGGWGVGAAAEDAARFYRVVDVEGGAGFCVMGIRAASRVRFLPQLLDSDGDTVPDCTDACRGQDDWLDADGDGLPDGCDPEPEIPGGMALVPAGPFEMGDPFGTGAATERPVHTVEVSAFFADQHEVSWALWQEVRAWAVANGYELGPGAGKGSDHPVQMVSWYDAVKWCNARSERAGLTPVYRTAAGEVHRTGDVDLRSEDVLWTANGFRLATEAEWEKAARGGRVGQQYPWGNQVDGSLANYGSSGDAYESGALPWTTPVGLYLANDYGLCDMAGNVFEWCWDWLDAGWYGGPEATQADPCGPTTAGTYRVARGGSWFWTSYAIRCGYRGWDEPRYRGDGLGLRCVRSQTVSGSRVLDLARVMAEPGPRLAAGETPTVEYASSASGPWQEDPYALIRAGADGSWDAIAGDGGARFFRLVTAGDAELPYCALVLGPAVRLEVIPAGRDTDGDTVPDCEDACPGDDDRIDLNGNRVPDCKESPGMALIPAGPFQMGNSFGSTEGWDVELPVHAVYVSEFWMDRSEVTKALWDEVRTWALAHGYSFDNRGVEEAADHPVGGVNWCDAVKWCNARSEKEGLVPCYYTSAAQTQVYRTGRLFIANDWVKWEANGYRLPTEAEWEKAARGGLVGKRFPWGNTISHSQANYYSASWPTYDVSPTRGYHPDYDGKSPVGSFAPNGYRLYDMAGNLSEWCWDLYHAGWYGRAEARTPDCKGPASSGSPSLLRVYRDGHDALHARCADRRGETPAYHGRGFRCARGQP